MHDCITRSGAHLRVLEECSGSRKLYVYGALGASNVSNTDSPFVAIDLDEDEADQLANLLHSRSISDRVADLERQLEELRGETN
jgi:TrkA domain protein